MPKTLYSPRLSDDVVRALYREGQRRRMPMTKLADDMLRQTLSTISDIHQALHLCEEPAVIPIRETDAA